MKKIVTFVLTLIISVSLCGCCLNHVWKDATCAEPKTCAKCGKTDGDALGHNWEDATCTEPKTCSRCGEKAGDALGHNWEDATYDAPKTCSRCGDTKGSALSLPTYHWNQTTSFDNFDITFDNTNEDPYKYGFVIVGRYDNFDDLLNGFKREVGDSRLDKLLYVMRHTMEFGEHLSYGGGDFYMNDNWDTNCKLELLILTQGSTTAAELLATKEEGITHYCPDIFE